MSISTVTSKGQVTLPKDVRLKLHLEKGEKVEFYIDEKSGTATLIPLTKKINDVFGILKNKGNKKSLTVDDMNTVINNKFKGGKVDRP